MSRLPESTGRERPGRLPVEVWYAAYGSNLLRARFMVYLEGGCPPGSDRRYPKNIGGVSPPTDDVWFEDPHLTLFFGDQSTTWVDPERRDLGSGIAFLVRRDDPADAPLVLRAYRITWPQFVGVVRAENTPANRELRHVGGLDHGPPSTDVTLPGAGAYDRLLVLGAIDGVPVLSFTASTLPLRNEPLPAYLGLLEEGRREARRGRKVELDAPVGGPQPISSVRSVR